MRRKDRDDLTALKDDVAALRRDLNGLTGYHEETTTLAEDAIKTLGEQIAALRDEIRAGTGKGGAR